MVVLEGDNLDFGEDFELNVRAWNYVGGSNAKARHDKSIMTIAGRIGRRSLWEAEEFCVPTDPRRSI